MKRLTILLSCAVWIPFLLACGGVKTPGTTPNAMTQTTKSTLSTPLTGETEVVEEPKQAPTTQRAPTKKTPTRTTTGNGDYDFDGLILLRESIRNHTDEYSGKNILGTVVNNRATTQKYVQVSFSLYDASGAKVGEALANVNNLKAGERWNFSASTFGKKFSSYSVGKVEGH